MYYNTETVLVLAEVAVFIAICFFTTRIVLKTSRNLPPGPIGLPFVGYLPFLTKKPHIKFCELRKKYGHIFGLYLGRHYTVVLGNPMAVKEAFNRPEFLGRPDRTALSPDKSRISISTLTGHPWVEQRRFIVHSMKDLGMGKFRMEEHIKDELSYLIEAIQSFGGEPFEIKPFLASSTNNVILAFTSARRLDYSDELRKAQNVDWQIITNFMAQTSVPGYVASVMKIPGLKKLFGYDEFRRSFNKTMGFIREEIKQHKEKLNETEPRDVISDYLLEIKNQQGNPSSSFSESMLEGSVMTLCLAGSETVRTTIDWALYVIAAFPAIQFRIQKEIDDAIGMERWPTWLDHKEMLYTQSVLTEVMRWRTPIPINLQRCALADTSLCGYDIPKGTVILANLWDVHHNSEYWENPEEFQATRFLRADECSTNKSENCMPFSYGKRSCPGQSLATVEVFLFVTTILQRFEISLPDGFKEDFEGELAIVNQPRPHKLRFTTRKPSSEDVKSAEDSVCSNGHMAKTFISQHSMCFDTGMNSRSRD